MNRFTVVDREAVSNMNLHNKLVLSSQLILRNGKLCLTPNNNLNLESLDNILKVLSDYIQRCEVYLQSYIVDTVLKLPKSMKYTRPLGFIVEIENEEDLFKLLEYRDLVDRYNLWFVIVTTFHYTMSDRKEIVNA